MIRAVRFAARLGWQMEEKTKARYETGKSEGYISAMSSFQRGYEVEEIVHEEDSLRVMRGLEHEGWMNLLAPTWTSAKANVAELEKLREAQAQLQMRGIVADASAAQFPLLTAKMMPKDVSALKKSFPRQGFVKEIEALESEGKKFAAEFATKPAATPSVAWKMLYAARPEAILWVAYTTKNAGLQAKFKSFYTDWPQARQKISYTQMQEMRIVPGIPGYDELVEKLFFELMDGKLGTPEEMKAFLEPYSPPAPPPPVHLRRARATKKEPKVSKARKKASADQAGESLEEVASAGEAAVADGVAAPAKVEKGKAAKAAEAKAPAPTKAAAPVKAAAPLKSAAKAPVATKVAAKKAPPAKKPVAKKVAAKPAAKKAVPAKAAAKKVMAKKAPAKPATKAKGKAVVKAGVSKPAKGSFKAHAKAPVKGKSKKKR
jgi:hypothetical protein